MITGRSPAAPIVQGMKNHFSTATLVAALAFLVPSNGAEADGQLAAAPIPTAALVASSFVEASAPYLSTGGGEQKEPDPTIAWMMALGFLGLVITRRLRDR